MQPKNEEFLNSTIKIINPNIKNTLNKLDNLRLEKIKYIQCVLQKTHNNSVIELITYIPEIFAKENNILSINGENGWKVVKIYTALEKFKEPYFLF